MTKKYIQIKNVHLFFIYILTPYLKMSLPTCNHCDKVSQGQNMNSCYWCQKGSGLSEEQTHLLRHTPAPVVVTTLALLRAPSPLVVYAATVRE